MRNTVVGRSHGYLCMRKVWGCWKRLLEGFEAPVVGDMGAEVTWEFVAVEG